jgi:hypothetical protein
MKILLICGVAFMGLIFILTAIGLILVTIATCSAIYQSLYPYKPKYDTQFDIDQSLDRLNRELEKLTEDWDKDVATIVEPKKPQKRLKNINILSFEKHAK